jgi:archaellum biogenesis protein FlaJ (TadC family)
MEKLNEILLKSGVITLSALMGAVTDTTILFACVFLLVLIDNILAIYVKLKFQTEPFDYKKLKTTIEKTMCYVLLLVGGIVLWILTDIKFYTGFAVYIGVYEFFSVMRHFLKITGNQVFADLLDYIKNKIDFIKYFKDGK